MRHIAEAELIGGPEDGCVYAIDQGSQKYPPFVITYRQMAPLIWHGRINDAVGVAELNFYREGPDDKRPGKPWRYHLRRNPR